MTSEDLTSWLTRIPKVELHLHLEGAVPLDALWTLIQKYGGDPSVPTFESLGNRFYTTLPTGILGVTTN